MAAANPTAPGRDGHADAVPGDGATRWVTLTDAGRTLRIEHAWVGVADTTAPLVVFLHEGLGSVAMWRDFPAQLCQALGCQGLVYSRPGYGRSTPRARDEAWGVDFMHRQAHSLLPGLLAVLGIEPAARPVYLLGHSDGGSIALLYAARHGAALAGTIVLAPHILVEDLSLASIAQARTAYQTTALRARLAKYHDDPDSAFWGWNNIWLHSDFKAWSIVSALADIACPVLAVQGLDDEYGTLAQIHGIAEQVPHTQLLALPQCGHSPHRDQPEALTAAVRRFIGQRTERPDTIAAPCPTP